MAAFNNPVESPQVGIVNPRQVTQPMADKSTGMLLDTGGKAIEGGFKLADTLEKQNIENQLYSKVRGMQDNFIDSLDNVAQSKGITYRDPMNANASMDVIPQPSGAPPIPDNVQGMVTDAAGQAQRLQDAYQAGKINRLGLDQRLYPILKDVRANVPEGYRDYVDQTMSRITGYNVANSLISEKLAQINAGASNAQKEQEYWEKQIVGSGFSMSGQVLQQFQQDHNIAKVQQWLATNNEQKAKVDNAVQAFKLSDAAQANLKQNAEFAANQAALHAATEFYTNRRLTTDDQTDQEIAGKLYELTMHPERRDDAATRLLGQQIQQHMVRNQQEVMGLVNNSYYTDPNSGKKYSIAQVLGPQKLGEIVQSNINNLYKVQLDALNNDQLGLVGSVQKQAGDIIANHTRQVLQNPGVGGITTTAGVLNKIAPNLSPELINQIWGAYKSINPQGSGSLGQDLISTIQTQKQQAIAQTGSDPNISADGHYTFKQSQSEISNVKGITQPQQSMAIKSYLDLTKAFKEKDPQVVDNATNYFFSPANQGSLSKLMDDYYDKNRGVIVSGRTAAFSQLTDPSVTTAIYNRAKNGNPTGWDNYKGWADREAVSNLTTVAKTWNDNEAIYNKTKNDPINPVTGDPYNDEGNHTDHHFYWDTKTHQIGLMNTKGQEVDIESSWRVNPDIFAVRNANKVLASMANIARQENPDDRHIDAFLFREMQRAGWSPTSLDVHNGTVPKRIIDAITHANKPPLDNIRDITGKDQSKP